jgi:hypothetical protein
MALQQFNIPDLVATVAGAPTEAEINAWAANLNALTIGLDNIIAFLQLPIAILPPTTTVAAGADQAARLAHQAILTAYHNQLIVFQELVVTKATRVTTRPPPRTTIKVQRPTFDGKPEHARGFLAGLATYQHLQPGDFPDDRIFIAWALACMEGPAVNPWKTTWLNRRANLVAAGQQLPLELTDWGNFTREFQGKFLNPNEVENAGRALTALWQIRSAREFAQEFDKLAEVAGLMGQPFLQDQF